MEGSPYSSISRRSPTYTSRISTSEEISRVNGISHYLTLTSGPNSGSSFELVPHHVYRLGRGIDCDIVLADLICSRVHAQVDDQGGQWMVRDLGSRNGTFVNDQQIDQPLALQPNLEIRIGATCLVFHPSDQPPTVGEAFEPADETGGIIRQQLVDTKGFNRDSIDALRQSDGASDLTLLYKMAIRLLECDEPHDVLRLTLTEVHQRTAAEVVGFLWVTDAGDLKPQMLIPPDSHDSARLSQSLTRVVVEQRRAVWVANQPPGGSTKSAESLRPFADAVCVPVIRDNNIMGAIHLYLGQGRFRDIDFEFAISVAQLLGAALARSRRQAILAAEHQRLIQGTASFPELIGNSLPMQKLKEKIQKIAPAVGSVLVVGESGSGKELVAEAIHRASSRSDRPLLAVNCAAIPANLVESQLFGHQKGAFTGATEDRLGWFRQADTGTLFLDEMGELPLDAQGKLLRILEGHPFLPVGSTTEVSVDVRVIAATNRDLREAVRNKTFREDLYYRLSVFNLKVPPLRDRESDIQLLIDHFFDHFKNRNGRPQLAFSPKAAEALSEYKWPGNVRQLRNVIDSAVVMANGLTIEPEDLGLFDAGTDHLDTLEIAAWEKKLIKMALRQTAGNIPSAAKLLGIGRATLYRKVDEYNIEKR